MLLSIIVGSIINYNAWAYMKHLFLIRHAKSNSNHPGLSDFDRPLDKQGERDAAMMGRRLAKRGVTTDLILSSPAKRALATARIIGGELGSPMGDIRTDKRIYEANLADLLHVIHEIDDVARTVILIGHNPGFNSMSYFLTSYAVNNIPSCGVFEVELNVNSWSDVAEGSGKFISFDYPKNF